MLLHTCTQTTATSILCLLQLLMLARMRMLVICSVLLIAVHSVVSQTRDQWLAAGRAELRDALSRRQNWGVAKNLVVFLGDGMGVSTVTAARILAGQRRGLLGEESFLSFDRFPDMALLKTYEVDRQVPDSAGTATAILSGVKTNMGVIGLDSSVKRGNCAGQRGKEVTSLLDLALQEGKSVGIVTTARVTHATPAAAFAHVAERDWENDASMRSVRGGCKDIALQLIADNPNIQVILGGGRRNFLPTYARDPETNRAQAGSRLDNRNLIQEWANEKKSRGVSHQFVWNRQQLASVNPATTDYLFGLFEESHMKFSVDRTKAATDDPTLAEMTQKALEILRKNDKGYFLFVEGARIDHGHHDNMAKRALFEVLDLDDAVTTADRMTSENDTLLVVTADHSHVFNIQGYSSRGNSILGKMDFALQPLDGKPTTTLVYANGPNSGRKDITGMNTEANDFEQFAGVPMLSETHSGEDVACYARGPMSHLLHATHEQNYVAHALAYAACLGSDKSHCTTGPRGPCADQTGSPRPPQSQGASPNQGQGSTQAPVQQPRLGQGQSQGQGQGQIQGPSQGQTQGPSQGQTQGAGQGSTQGNRGPRPFPGIFPGAIQSRGNTQAPRRSGSMSVLRNILDFLSRL